MVDPVATLDRRQRRRQESIEEILDVALELMAEHGVAGLSLGEVARRLGIRPPSLYGYFASKHALYDAVFARGAQDILDTATVASADLFDEESLDAVLLRMGTVMVRWAISHPVYTQLMFWRPVPGFEPTSEAYQPAVALIDLSRGIFADLQSRGWLRDDITAEEILRDWTILTAGIVSQQLSNAPQEDFESGRFTTALPTVVAMFGQHYARESAATDAAPPSPSTPPQRRTRRARQR
jgi:AcrR family transcriptional regulator